MAHIQFTCCIKNVIRSSRSWWISYTVTIGLTNKNDNKCFQYAVLVALNHEEIRKHCKRIAKIKAFINTSKIPSIISSINLL